VSSIEWTEETWNPTTGCDRISPGCDNCYALKMAGRLKLMGQAKYQRDGDPRTSGPGFGLTVHEDVLDVPLRRRKPTTYFVNSMSDLFHKDVSEAFIAEVFAVMALTPQHTYQVLTKRAQRLPKLLADPPADPADWLVAKVETAIARRHPTVPYVDGGWDYLLPGVWDDAGLLWPLPNVWLGTSIESDRYTFRADHLRATPAAVRFLSLEPLLGPLPSLDLTGIDWVITGAESGPGARAMDLGWVRDIRDRCTDAGVPLFFKQDAVNGRKKPLPELDGEQWVQMPERRKAVPA
jgi:protein gp37